jgi:hypothetical protein
MSHDVAGCGGNVFGGQAEVLKEKCGVSGGRKSASRRESADVSAGAARSASPPLRPDRPCGGLLGGDDPGGLGRRGQDGTGIERLDEGDVEDTCLMPSRRSSSALARETMVPRR